MEKKKDFPVIPEAEALIRWYWTRGHERRGAYTIALSDWLAPLYHLHNSAVAIESSLAQPRPAMAIWGPSQTGKSTSVSAYMDAGARYTGESAEEDGKGSGLHWEGGPGFFFMAPLVEDTDALPVYLNRKVLNPYNKGMDGSSCLTRFTGATADGAGNGSLHQVTRRAHPVEIHFVTPRNLLLALACGYSSECVNPRGNEPKHWSLEGFEKAFNLVKQRVGAPSGRPRRDAFERLFDLSEVLLGLAEMPGGTWSSLGDSMETFRSRLRSMLEDAAFLCDANRVDMLAGELLWEGQKPLTDYYRKMRDTWADFLGEGGHWSGKPVFASLEAAALFLNMEACVISYKARQPDQSPEGVIQELLARLGWSEHEDCVLIDCAGTNSIGADPERFSILQGLVWELVVPVNLGNLPDRPFPDQPDRKNALKDFLREADLLDFPGVANSRKSKDNRILLDPRQIEHVRRRAAEPDANSSEKALAERAFTPALFFKEIVKRGKTASIVATYARRLNIDGFSIFQGIRGHPCPNADQLIHGIKSWWRHAVPEYAANPVGASPLPLNIVLTWWATPLNQAKNPNDSNIYGVVENVVSNLGPLRDPETAVTFAIHYHYSPHREFAELTVDFTPGSQRHTNLFRESSFARQFKRAISKRSFDEMVTDLRTGGAEFFFTEALRQLRESRANTETNRLHQLKDRESRLRDELIALLKHRHLRPVPRPKDERRERLIAFRKQLRQTVDEASDADLMTVNHALRQLLDVPYEFFDTVPLSPDAVFVETQMNRWVTRQTRRWDEVTGGRPLARSWAMLGLGGKEAVQSILEALLLSIRPDFEDIAVWLNRIVSKSQDLSLRRLFALRLQNLLCYSGKGARVSLRDDFEDVENVRRPGYEFFLSVWLEAGGTLETLIEREIHPVKRPDQPGDAEIEAVARRLQLPPADY